MSLTKLIRANKLIEQNNKGIMTKSSIKLMNTKLNMDGAGNCWGTTLYCLGALNGKLRNLQADETWAWLTLYTKRISKWNGVRKRSFGDILIITNKSAWYHHLVHTALYLGDGLYFHQQGYEGKWLIGSLKEIQGIYTGEFYHVKANDKKTWEKV